jgi:phosphotriesterase-related protein
MTQQIPEPAYPAIGIYSGKVQTALGPISVEELGITLMHEHIFLDASSWWQEPATATRKHIAYQPVHIGILGELRLDPFINLDNCKLLNFEDAIAELMLYRDLGGATLVDVTNNDIGRDPLALQQISRRTGLQIVFGTGHYLEDSHPKWLASMSVQDIEGEIVREILHGIPGLDVRPGIIGEIGVSAHFTPAEQKVLRAAASASGSTQMPLTIHMPGWERLGHQVLDLVGDAGGVLDHTILDHMNPSLMDIEYQISLADRGAFLEYDMIGMDYFYADQQAQSPCDEENAIAIKRLIDAGYINSLLLSQDVFLKMMLTRYGGFGYGYILRHFVPRLKRHGVTSEQIHALLVENPRRVFSARYRREGKKE